MHRAINDDTSNCIDKRSNVEHLNHIDNRERVERKFNSVKNACFAINERFNILRTDRSTTKWLLIQPFNQWNGRK